MLLQLYLLTALLFVIVPFLAFYLVSLRGEEVRTSKKGPLKRFSVIIPAYKERRCLIENVEALLYGSYPINCSDVIVVCDDCPSYVVEEIKSFGVTVLDVVFEKSTKVRALQEALPYLSETTEEVVILDADNMVEEGFFEILSAKIDQGYRVVQGERVAKNRDSSFASMDALSEVYNNLLFREIRDSFHLSSALIGSGFSMDVTLFRSIIPTLTAVGGFDKELEIRLVLENVKIGYAKGAKVLDEKIDTGKNFENQRRRWISAQMVYCKERGRELLISFLKSGRIDLLDRFLQLALPPRTITLLLWGITTLLSLLFPASFWHWYFWFFIGFLYGMTFVYTFWKEGLESEFFNSLLSLPRFFLHMVKALLRIGGANKEFIHTTHR